MVLFVSGSPSISESVSRANQPNLADELVTNPTFNDYQLRVTDPKLCDPSVKQHSGYLDISDGKHLFFWYANATTLQRTVN